MGDNKVSTSGRHSWTHAVPSKPSVSGEKAHQQVEQVAALVDIRRSFHPFSVMDSRRIGGIEDLRSTVRFLSVPDELRNFLTP